MLSKSKNTNGITSQNEHLEASGDDGGGGGGSSGERKLFQMFKEINDEFDQIETFVE